MDPPTVVPASSLWPLTSEGQELHPQNMAAPQVLGARAKKKPVAWLCLHRMMMITPFLYFHSPFPGSTHSIALSYNYPKPKPLAFGEVGLGSVLPSPLLAAVWINSLLQTSVSQPLTCCTLGKWTCLVTLIKYRFCWCQTIMFTLYNFITSLKFSQTWLFSNWEGMPACPVSQLCSTLCDPMDCSQSGSSIYGISQARILEGVAIYSSRRSSWPRDWTPSPMPPALAGRLPQNTLGSLPRKE